MANNVQPLNPQIVLIDKDGKLNSVGFRFFQGIRQKIEDGSFQPADPTLTALAALDAVPGILVQTGSDAFTKRTLTGTENEVDVAFGTGLAGNPTISLPDDLILTGKTITGGAFVVESLAADGQILGSDGSNASPSFGFSSDPGTGFLLGAPEAIHFTIGGSVRGTFTATGINNAAIGTTTPSTGTFTELNADGGGALTGTWTSLGTVITVDINGGTMDGVTIGGSDPEAGTFTSLSSTSGALNGTLGATTPNTAEVTTLTVGGGTSIAVIAHATYTPTTSDTTNVTTSSAGLCHYERIGNRVSVWGSINVTPTAAGDAATELGISLPIASNFAATTDARGVAASSAAQRAGEIRADASNDRVSLLFASEVTGDTAFSFHFSYAVI